GGVRVASESTMIQARGALGVRILLAPIHSCCRVTVGGVRSFVNREGEERLGTQKWTIQASSLVCPPHLRPARFINDPLGNVRPGCHCRALVLTGSLEQRSLRVPGERQACLHRNVANLGLTDENPNYRAVRPYVANFLRLRAELFLPRDDHP